MKFKKRYKEIEAEQFLSYDKLPDGVTKAVLYSDRNDIGGRRPFDSYTVVTIHGQKTRVVLNDWIIKEPDGIHYYPCKPEIFDQTYEAMECESPSDEYIQNQIRDMALNRNNINP